MNLILFYFSLFITNTIVNSKIKHKNSQLLAVRHGKLLSLNQYLILKNGVIPNFSIQFLMNFGR